MNGGILSNGIKMSQEFMFTLLHVAEHRLAQGESWLHTCTL